MLILLLWAGLTAVSLVSAAEGSHSKCPNGPYLYYADVMAVMNGETLIVNIDLGLGVTLTDKQVRIIGINAPEMVGKKADAGQRAYSFLRDKLNIPDKLIPPGSCQPVPQVPTKGALLRGQRAPDRATLPPRRCEPL